MHLQSLVHSTPDNLPRRPQTARLLMVGTSLSFTLNLLRVEDIRYLTVRVFAFLHSLPVTECERVVGPHSSCQ